MSGAKAGEIATGESTTKDAAEKLAVLPAWKDPTILLPDWQNTTSMIVHDEFAEAANY